MRRFVPLVVLAGLLVAPWYLRNFGLYLLSLWALTAIAAMGLNLTLGYAGQKSLAQAAFMGIGAYATALMLHAGWPYFAAIPAATLLAFAAGLAIGFPALRVRFHYLAFATLGFNMLVFLVIRNEEWLTGGSMGISQVVGFAGVPRPTLFGVSFRSNFMFYHLCLAMLVVATAVLWWLLRTPWGRAFAALRDNPVRAESLGVDVRAYTLLAFAIGAAFAGFAGVFMASLIQLFDPSPFGFVESLSLLLMVVVGGSGRFWGPHLGAGLVVIVPNLLQGLVPAWMGQPDRWYLLAFGVFVVALLAWCPGGILAIPERLRARR